MRLFCTHKILLISHHRIPFLQASGHFFDAKKQYRSKGPKQAAFKVFLASNLAEFHHTDMNNLVD